MKFEEFYTDTFDRVYKYFYYKSVAQSAIEDLAHESYLRFHKKYQDKLSNQSECIKIMLGICQNVYREWVRQQVKENKTEYKDEYNYFEEEIFNQDFEDKLEIYRKEVRKAITSLHKNVRLVLEYRFLKGLSRKEIALKLNISEDDVHTYQKRGVKYLKKLIIKD